MKSRLLTTVFEDLEAENAKRFERHFRETLDLSEEHRQRCLSAIAEVRAARMKVQANLIVENLAKETGLPSTTLEHSLSIMGFWIDALINESIPEGDQCLWKDDLLEAGWLDPAKLSVFVALLEQLESLSPELHFQSVRQRTSGGVLPRFQALGCTVEVRPIRKTRFRCGESVDSFAPEFLGTVLVASMHVGVDVGPVEDFYFQADEADIDTMIDSLRATKKEMAALRRFLRLEHSARRNADD